MPTHRYRLGKHAVIMTAIMASDPNIQPRPDLGMSHDSVFNLDGTNPLATAFNEIFAAVLDLDVPMAALF